MNVIPRRAIFVVVGADKMLLVGMLKSTLEDAVSGNLTPGWTDGRAKQSTGQDEYMPHTVHPSAPKPNARTERRFVHAYISVLESFQI